MVYSQSSGEAEKIADEKILGRLGELFVRPTLPETNSSHLKIGHPKRKLVLQPSIFRGRDWIWVAHADKPIKRAGSENGSIGGFVALSVLGRIFEPVKPAQ